MNLVLIGSINVNGLRNDKKRQTIFNWLKRKKYDLVILQEIHCENSKEEQDWTKDWNGPSKRCYGTRLSKSVAILIKERANLKILSYNGPGNGRIISFKIEVNELKIQVLNVYAQNYPSERKYFIKNLQNIIDINYTEVKKKHFSHIWHSILYK